MQSRAGGGTLVTPLSASQRVGSATNNDESLIEPIAIDAVLVLRRNQRIHTAGAAPADTAFRTTA